MSSLYLDCGSGISGDMIVAALLDAGASQENLMRALDSIDAEGYEIKISRVTKSGLDCCDFDVVLDKDHDGHDHDMEYLYGHTHDFSDEAHAHDSDVAHPDHKEHSHTLENHHHTHSHEIHDHIHEHHEHQHEHEAHDSHHEHHEHGTHDSHHEHHEYGTHDSHHEHHEHHEHGAHDSQHEYHEHGDHGHHHEHRGLSEINAIIDTVSTTDSAKALAKRIFYILAQAEAKAHATTVENVHFHEVGAIDSIVDIIAAAVCFDDLGITEVIIPKLCDGQGSVRCQHGIIPVPVPAVMNIAQMYKLPLSITEKKGEFVTPTGAAFAAAVITGTKLPEVFIPQKVGMGAGKRTYKEPSILRAIIY